MANQIDQILKELYELDSELKNHEPELIRIINEILKSRPDTKFDENFAKKLRAQLLGESFKQESKIPLSLIDILTFKPMQKIGYTVGILAIVTILVVPVFYITSINKHLISPMVSGKIDDWQFDMDKLEKKSLAGRGSGLGLQYGVATGLSGAKSLDAGMVPLIAESNIGFSVGGAKDINNFRTNIKNNFLPLPTDITYEGLFYDYFFDTGQKERCEKLFCPAYSYAIAPDPLSGETEYYLAVGLNSGIQESDFKRKKLNLTIVLDISGSMDSPFNRYYYDRFGNQQEVKDGDKDAEKNKMELAAKSVVNLTNHLDTSDKFGMVLFNNSSFLAKPMSLVATTNMGAIKNHILEIQANGGTNMSAGIKEATNLYDELTEIDPVEYENRIIFLTDAMPNLGDTSEEGLLEMTKKNAARGIYTTFIGIGVDFNTELIETITKIKGANYYSVHSAIEFKERMDEGFEYMVTPLVFDLNLKLEADGYEIEKVYGSPEANEATGEIMKVNTLFPSKQEAGEARGGLVLLKLKKLAEDGSLILKTSYEDRNGKKISDEKTILIDISQDLYFANDGIRKGILLSRYANLIKNWIIDERKVLAEEKPITPAVDHEVGIVVPPPEFTLGKWERQSVPLKISDDYREIFSQFEDHFKQEKKEINDDNLEQELDILEKLLEI